MIDWLYQVRQNIGKIVDAIDFYNDEILSAKKEVSLKGSVEKHASELPGIVETRFSQLQEIESILEFLNIEHRKMRSQKFKKFLEHYNKTLSSRDAEKYVDSEVDIVDMQHLINEFAVVRNKMQGIIKALDQKSYAISNLIRLRVAGFDDMSI
jgi:uncharacterized protein YfdQ (DUF2303 family)